MADVNPNLKKTERTIRRRVECEKRAFHIINELIDGFVSEQHLSECGKLMSKENYDDVVEERAIGLLCGYPICEDKLPHTPKKKYHISTKTNTVYDISERKSFCSNQCFKASKFFRHQIPESPVWSREEEVIDIVVSLHKSQPGLVGDKVVGTNPTRTLEQEVEKLNEMDMKYTEKNVKHERNVKRNESEDCTNSQDAKKPNKAVSNPIRKSDTQPACVNVEEVQSDLDRLNLEDSRTRLSGAGPDAKVATVDASPVWDENDEHVSKVTVEHVTAGKQINSKPVSNLERLQKLMNQKKKFLSKMVDSQEVVKAPTHPEGQQTNVGHSDKDGNHPYDENSKKQRLKPRKCRPEKPIQSPPSPLRALCQILKSWMSVSTVDFLKFKHPHPHPTNPSHTPIIDPASATLSSLEVQVGATSLSANLRSQEKRLNSILGEDDNDDHGEERKAVPDYKALREESEQFTLKVTEYITGKRPKDQHKKVKDDPDDPVYIPTVDAYDQAQIRTKLVLEKLDKCLPSVLDPMGLALQDVAAPMRQLVYTFRLERDTITFKPAQWTLVSLLLLKMLSLKVPSIEECFQTESTHHFLSVLLRAINQQVDDLDLYTTDMLAVAAVDFVE